MTSIETDVERKLEYPDIFKGPCQLVYTKVCTFPQNQDAADHGTPEIYPATSL